MNLKLKRTPGIYLIGFMGSGKTTIGRMLAEEIGWFFADLDDDIESQQRRSISDLFDTLGEEEFRRIETQALQKRINAIGCGVPTVLALGGGTFTREENVRLLENNGITVWIDTVFSVVKRRVEGSTHRPLARDPGRFQQLYEARRSHYGRAEYHVQVLEDDSRRAMKSILALPLFE